MPLLLPTTLITGECVCMCVCVCVRTIDFNQNDFDLNIRLAGLPCFKFVNQSLRPQSENVPFSAMEARYDAAYFMDARYDDFFE